MKKAIILCLILVIFITVFPVIGSANTEGLISTEQNFSTKIPEGVDKTPTTWEIERPIQVEEVFESSIRVSEETLNRIGGVEEGERVIKLYGQSFLDLFSDFDSFEEMLGGPTYFPAVYLLYKEDALIGTIGFSQIEKVYERKDGVSWEGNRFVFDEIQTGKRIKMVAKNIKIQDVYAIRDVDESAGGIAVYYKTNLGGYVCYRNAGGQEFVYPEQVFIQKKTDEKKRMEEFFAGKGMVYGDVDDGLNDNLYNIDSEEFIFKTSSSFPAMLITGFGVVCAVLVAGGVVGVILVKKRKKVYQEK